MPTTKPTGSGGQVAKMNDLEKAALDAYITLLRLPPQVRIYYHHVLCDLRDALAEARGIDEETVQTSAEDAAMTLGPLR